MSCLQNLCPFGYTKNVQVAHLDMLQLSYKAALILQQIQKKYFWMHWFIDMTCCGIDLNLNHLFVTESLELELYIVEQTFYCRRVMRMLPSL